ncbi:MAG: hypothetical protein AAGA29_10460 [Planctomycetota bacterium]
MNSKLLIALGVVVVLGIAVFAWTRSGDGGSNVAEEMQEFHCCFDDTVVAIAAEDMFKARNAGEAIFNTGPGAPPTRVKCTECGRMSCFKLDPSTGNEITVDPSWDLEATPDSPRRVN